MNCGDVSIGSSLVLGPPAAASEHSARRAFRARNACVTSCVPVGGRWPRRTSGSWDRSRWWTRGSSSAWPEPGNGPCSRSCCCVSARRSRAIGPSTSCGTRSRLTPARRVARAHLAAAPPGPSGELLVTRPPGYALAVGARAVDLRRFERLVEAGDRALGNDDPAAAVDSVRDPGRWAEDAAVSAPTARVEDASLVAVMVVAEPPQDERHRLG